MAMETKGIEIKNKGLLLFGVILLVIGLGASFYVEVKTRSYEDWSSITQSWEIKTEETRTYPYQGIGMVLVLLGVVFVALGFFYSPRTSETREKERVSIPAPPENL